MDIIRPLAITFPYGGPLAVRWNICGSPSSELYYNEVVPWATEQYEVMKKRVIKVEKFPPYSKLEPAFYIAGPDREAYTVTTGSFKQTEKTKRKRSEFEAAKRDGKILVSPMLNCKMQARATPRISSAKVEQVPRIGRIDYISYGAVAPRCRFRWRGIPALELDSFGSAHSWDAEILRDAYVRPVSQRFLDDCMGDVMHYLGSMTPSSELVTNTVAEANSATFDIATEIGEMPETIKLILNGVIGGIKLLLRMKREVKQKIGSGSSSHDMAALWMQYRYAISPIVYSINDGLDLLAFEARKFQSFRGRSDQDVPSFNLPGGYELISKPSVSHRCFLKYGYDMDSPVSQGLKINLAATAWELLPLSFVWDWFFQVGDFLTASFTPGVVNQIACTYSYRVNGTYIWSGPEGSTISIDVDYYRSTVIQPNSFIGINSDVFVSFKRAMDALSLSWLLFKKRK